MSPTPNIARIRDRLDLMWPGSLTFQFYNRRHIGSNPLKKWSQHAGSEPERGWYGNAVDIFDPTDSYDSALLDDVHAYLQQNRERLQIRTILWRVAHHHDHIHCDTWPKLADEFWRRPPPKGPVVTISKSGKVSNSYEEDEVPQFTDEEAEQLKGLVMGLNAADPADPGTGYSLAKWGIRLIRREKALPLHKPTGAVLDLTKLRIIETDENP